MQKEKQQLQQELVALEERKEAELQRREADMKEFTRSRMREINDQVAKDEKIWERRLRDKEKEKEEIAEKYAIAKRKIEELVEKYSTLQEKV